MKHEESAPPMSSHRPTEPPPGPPVDAPDWFARALAADVVTGRVDVAGCPIAFRQWGRTDHTPLVLVHGNSASAHWWDHVAPFLAADGFCVTALDLSGNGDSGWREEYSWAQWADEVVTVASRAAGVGHPYVVAHSMGGRVAVLAGAETEWPWAGLVVVDVAISPSGEPVTQPPAAPAESSRKTYPTMAEAVARFRLKDVPDDVGLPYVVQHVAETSLTQLAEGVAWKRDVRTSVRSDPRPGVEALIRVSCPVAWIGAEHGKVSSDLSADLSAGYSRVLGRPVPVVEIPAAYHHIMMDRPLALVSALRAILAMWVQT
jgi:pimeloyl-ACP methyl ester carboxylesterase